MDRCPKCGAFGSILPPHNFTCCEHHNDRIANSELRALLERAVKFIETFSEKTNLLKDEKQWLADAKEALCRK
jgi:hypothetical protein